MPVDDLAPKSNSYVFTNMLKDDDDASSQYDSLRSLAQRRGSLFLSIMLTCEVDEQIRRIDTPDRIARLKGSDPEGYRRHRKQTKLFQPPAEDVIHIDSTDTHPKQNAKAICETLAVDDLICRALSPKVRLPGESNRVIETPSCHTMADHGP